MKRLGILLVILGLMIAAPSVAGDCFINGRIAMTADGATDSHPPKPDIFMVIMDDGSTWQIAISEQHLSDARAGSLEGRYAQVCENWAGFSLNVRGGRSYSVLETGIRITD